MINQEQDITITSLPDGRKVYSIDTGKLPEESVKNYIEKMMAKNGAS